MDKDKEFALKMVRRMPVISLWFTHVTNYILFKNYFRDEK